MKALAMTLVGGEPDHAAFSNANKTLSRATQCIVSPSTEGKFLARAPILPGDRVTGENLQHSPHRRLLRNTSKLRMLTKASSCAPDSCQGRASDSPLDLSNDGPLPRVASSGPHLSRLSHKHPSSTTSSHPKASPLLSCAESDIRSGVLPRSPPPARH